MIADTRTHWQRIHETKEPAEVSWYQAVPQRSLQLIQIASPPLAAPILDVGAGACTLVDHLLAAGFTDVTLLDITPAAFSATKARLGATAERVHWIAADITAWQPTRRYRLWHDRAVFHFLVDAALRARYVDVLRAALAPGGHLVMATFGPEGPTRCSGLAAQRYSVAELNAVLGGSFHLRHSQIEEHITPAGHTQQFLYGCWQSET